ncbi:MAG: transketolase family protein [Euryarchaeota archaeon]|nr:transketolase family protein [Euryarchaeota archaeon]
MVSQRDAYAETLVALGAERKDVVVLSADLSSSVRTSVFADHFPERHFNIGIAEQNMMGIAAGLAASGKTVFASTFAIFGTGRVYDQVRQSIAYPRMKVNIVVTHAGITVGGDGATHQMIEDIALMRGLPNMTVIVPVDAYETKKAIRAAVSYDGPTYIRLGRSEVPLVTQENDPFEIGKAATMVDGKDVTLVGTGIMVAKCIEASDELRKHGVEARVINMSTIKPLDVKTLVKAARETGGVVTAEEHSVSVGMGSAVALALGENVHVPMRRVGIEDTFGESGESEELMEKYGLTVESIVDAAHDVLRRKGR